MLLRRASCCASSCDTSAWLLPEPAIAVCDPDPVAIAVLDPEPTLVTV